MFLELAIGAAIVAGAALWWAWYSTPEAVLARFVRELGYPGYTLDDFQTTQGRLDLIRDELAGRYQDWCRDVMDFAFATLAHGEARVQLHSRLCDMLANEPGADALNSFYDDCFFDLQYRALAADVVEDYNALEDRSEALAAQLHLLAKLERSFPEVRAT